MTPIFKGETNVETENVQIKWTLRNPTHLHLWASSGMIIGPEGVTKAGNLVFRPGLAFIYSNNIEFRIDRVSIADSVDMFAVSCDVQMTDEDRYSVSRHSNKKCSRSESQVISFKERCKDPLPEYLIITVSLEISINVNLRSLLGTAGSSSQSASSVYVSNSEMQLLNDMNALNASQVHPDLSICVCGTTFSGHKSVFSARSSVFKAMFDLPMTEQREGALNIEDASPETWGRFQAFLYTARVSFNDMGVDGMAELLMLADKYDVQTLKQDIAERLKSEVTVKNALEILELADKYSLENLMEDVDECLESKVTKKNVVDMLELADRFGTIKLRKQAISVFRSNRLSSISGGAMERIINNPKLVALLLRGL